MKKEMIADLIEISHFAARHPEWVQGGGGNCSVKEDGKMAIKASGYLLEDLTETDGYVVTELETGKAVKNDHLRASMESPLHTFLGKYVIHTHPIETGAIACAAQGPEVFDDLFPENHAIWIDYATPGQKLFTQVEAALKRVKHSTENDTILLLQNHGLFVSAADKERCLELYRETIERCEKLFAEAAIEPVDIKMEQFLTPDHAVYLSLDQDNLSVKQAQAAKELLEFSRAVLARIQAMNWQPRFLNTAQTAELLGMDEEKYRQNLWGKK